MTIKISIACDANGCSNETEIYFFLGGNMLTLAERYQRVFQERNCTQLLHRLRTDSSVDHVEHMEHSNSQKVIFHMTDNSRIVIEKRTNNYILLKIQ